MMEARKRMVELLVCLVTVAALLVAVPARSAMADIVDDWGEIELIEGPQPDDPQPDDPQPDGGSTVSEDSRPVQDGKPDEGTMAYSREGLPLGPLAAGVVGVAIVATAIIVLLERRNSI